MPHSVWRQAGHKNKGRTNLGSHASLLAGHASNLLLVPLALTSQCYAAMQVDGAVLPGYEGCARDGGAPCFQRCKCLMRATALG